MKSVKYLERLQKEQNLNDAATARLLNLTGASISHYKSGRRVMEHETCLAIGLALGMARIDAMEIVIAADIERAEKAGQKSLWSVFSETMTATAASAVMVASVTLFLTPDSANAAPSPMKAPVDKNGSVYIMSNRLYGSALCLLKIVRSTPTSF